LDSQIHIYEVDILHTYLASLEHKHVCTGTGNMLNTLIQSVV